MGGLILFIAGVGITMQIIDVTYARSVIREVIRYNENHPENPMTVSFGRKK